MSTPSNTHSQVDQKGQTSSEWRKDSVRVLWQCKPKDYCGIFVLCWVIAPQSALCPYLVTCEYDLIWRPSLKRHRSGWWALIHHDWYHPKGKHRHTGRWRPWDVGMEAGIRHHRAEGCRSYWPSQWVKRKLRKRPPWSLWVRNHWFQIPYLRYWKTMHFISGILCHPVCGTWTAALKG